MVVSVVNEATSPACAAATVPLQRERRTVAVKSVNEGLGGKGHIFILTLIALQ